MGDVASRAVSEVLGFDHVYVAVADLEASVRFYDAAMKALGFRSNRFELGGDPHVQYYNRHFGFVLRPARVDASHEPYAPGLHHLCFRVDREADVDEAARDLRAAGVDVTDPRRYPEYAPDYYAFFFRDPDGLRLEVTNYRAERRRRHDHWE